MYAVSRVGAVFLTAWLCAVAAYAAQSPDMSEPIAPNGMEKVEFCERCHGINGFTDNPNMPRLAGQNKGYLIKQLKNFRKGIRKSTPMRQVAVTLTDEEIENLADYFSRVEIELKP